jgi:hypothetical protein
MMAVATEIAKHSEAQCVLYAVCVLVQHRPSSVSHEKFQRRGWMLCEGSVPGGTRMSRTGRQWEISPFGLLTM